MVVVGIVGAQSLLTRSRSGQVTACFGGDYEAVATPGWMDINLGATSRPYRKYFEPGLLDRQAERIGPDTHVDKLHPTTIRTPEGSLGALFLDNTGGVVLAAKYPLVRPFSEGLAVVGTAVDVARGHILTNFGYIDRTGRLAIDPVYDNAERFREGRAAVAKGNRWGYIDREGQVVIPMKYVVAEEFHDGMARVWPDHDTIQFIDTSGKVLFASEQGSVGQFSEGLLFAVHPSRPGVGPISRWGYMDREFRFVFNLDDNRFGRCLEFYDGRAAVELARGNPPRWGFLSREGEVVIAGPFSQVEHFSEGLAAVTLGEGNLPQWGYINKAGDGVIKPNFLQTTPFSEGLAAVLVLDEDDKGEVGGAVPRPRHGPTPKLPRGRWGYIDREGHMVIEPKFYRAEPFANGLAYVHENPYVDGYIDKAGSFVWKLTEPKPEP
jgi:hypothetical protein